MAGVNAHTGEMIDGETHIIQSLEKIITTAQGERVMREWFGNPGLDILGDNITQSVLLKWFGILYSLIDIFEPRADIDRFIPNSVDRAGLFDFTMSIKFRPYAHLDFNQSPVFVTVKDGAVRIEDGQ
jgi:phage baseplate assembly protein W